MLQSKEDIASIVDTDWEEYYEERTDHLITEAENIIMDDNKRMLKIGKHIFTNDTPKDKQGDTKEWQKSYITDIFQEMIDKGEKLYCVLIQKNWMEFDTVQDFKRIGGGI